jgi:glycosyltransferase involved in cell wall biosynthesis
MALTVDRAVPRVSVVIPAYNAAQTLDECLQAVRRSSCEDYEIIVVDDGSMDSSAAIADRHGCRVVRLEANEGAAVAKNVGASQASGEILLFTDADVLVRSDTVQRVIEHLQEPGLCAVVGLLGRGLRYADFPSHFKNLWMHYTYSRLASRRTAESGVGLFYTSIAAIRRDVFLEMGGFDTRYRGASVTEDIEFGQRLLTQGHRVRLDACLEVEHLKRYSLLGVLRTDLRRAFGLTKTWLRKKLHPGRQAVAQRYYASVPWFFIVSVPLSWMLPVFLGMALITRLVVWFVLAGLDVTGILIANAPFLLALWRARGWAFLIQSCLFLPLDLWVSGLGVLWAAMDYLRGRRY